MRTRPLLVLAGVSLLAGCERIRDTTERMFDSRTPRERYVESLEAAGLSATALVRDWRAAADAALADAPLVAAPHVEEGYLTAGEPAALAFRLSVRRGQEMLVDARMLGDTTTTLFIEVWYAARDSARTLEQVAVADSGARTLTHDPRRDGEYVVRVQPELGRGGRFRIQLSVGPTLAFPVGGGTDSDIGSKFGAPRDGGVRSHHGIDIFARRGTPALATSVATVTRVETTPVGGNVVWMRDDRGNRLYYAHLDRQVVVAGQRVAPGDTVGFVGNTGNARTTPPHLHFGVYQRGPVDPYWFVHRPRSVVARLVADTSMLGAWARTARAGAALRLAPDDRATAVRTLPQYTPLRVVAAVGAWFRVRLPDGATGYVSAPLAERALASVRTVSLAAGANLLVRPVAAFAGHDVLADVRQGESVDVLGEYGDYWLVRTARDEHGWLAQVATEAPE